MAYADYDYYLSRYGGNAIGDESTFRRFALRASREIDLSTFGSIGSDDDNVKMCCCEIADILYSDGKASSSASVYRSETVGPHSVTYISRKEARDAVRSEIYDAITRWLLVHGAMYRGIAKAEG